MRVLFVSPYLPSRDGIADYTAILRRGETANGHEVAVVCAGERSADHPEAIAALPGRRALALELAVVRGWAPDVVHVQFATAAFGPKMPALLRFLDRLRDLPGPRVVTMHEVTRDLALLRAVGPLLYRRLAGWADEVIVHTGAARTALIGIGVEPSKVRRIPHPRARLPSPVLPKEELLHRFALGEQRILLAFGFIHVDKGLPDLVRGLHLLVERDRTATADLRLVVAGAVRTRRGMFRLFELRDRVHLAAVTRLVRRLGLTGRVVFTGYVPSGDVANWFAVSSAVVLPYRRIEMSGVASLAAAAGVPILASDVGGLGEESGSLAGTFPPCDPPRLADALEAHLRAVRTAAPATPGHGVPAQDPRSLDAVVRATLAVYAPMAAARTEAVDVQAR